MKTTIIVGIAGASASGKTSFARHLYQALCSLGYTDMVGWITEDSYYRDQQHLSMAERELTNYDHPDALEHELLYQHLLDLQKGQSVTLPVYDYTQHCRSQRTQIMHPKTVILIDGILLFTHPKIRNTITTKVFIDTPLDICLSRRLIRDVEERGRTVASVLTQFNETVRPMYQAFIDPSKQYADIIVPKGGENHIAIEVIKAHISQLLVNENEKR